MSKKRDTDKLSELLASYTEDMLVDDLPQHFGDDTVKIERILLDLVRPDPVQPRRVLPDRIHHAFHNNHLTLLQSFISFIDIRAMYVYNLQLDGDRQEREVTENNDYLNEDVFSPQFGRGFLRDYARRLINDPKVTIVEIVANSWDAGANRVDILWPARSGGEFSITDDGTGMSYEEFRNIWTLLSYSRSDQVSLSGAEWPQEQRQIDSAARPTTAGL